LITTISSSIDLRNNWLFSLSFVRFYLFLSEREREREREKAQAGGEAEGEADSPLSREPNAGLHPRSWLEPKADA